MIMTEKDEHVEVEKDTPAIYQPAYEDDSSLVPMNISGNRLDYLDVNTVSEQYYNNFNFSKLSSKYESGKLTLGITSAGKGEGKTLVASNMAVSLARAYRQRTVIVDMNFQNPQLHKVFGGGISPGLAEAMQTQVLRISPTMVENLFLLTAGEVSSYRPGIQDTISLREILYTLKNEFDFIIVDMCSVFPIEDFPIHFINEVDGLIPVIDAKHTKKDQLQKMYKHIDKRRFMGYIFNRVNKD